MADTDIDRDTDTDEDVGTDAATTEAGRRKVAKNALQFFDPEFEEQVGPGLVALLKEQKVSQADVEKWQSSLPSRTDGSSISIVRAAKGALGNRIAKNYPDWDHVMVGEYIDAGTVNDFQDTAPTKSSSPQRTTTPTETVPKRGTATTTSSPPSKYESPGGSTPASTLKAPNKPEVEQALKEDAEQKQEGANKSAIPLEYKDRLEQMFQVYK